MRKHNLRNKAWYLVKDLEGRTVKVQYRVYVGADVYEQFDVEGGGRLPVWGTIDDHGNMQGLRVAETAVPIMPPIDETEELFDYYYSATQEQHYINMSGRFGDHRNQINAIDGKIYTEATMSGKPPMSLFSDLEYLCTDRMSRRSTVGYY